MYHTNFAQFYSQWAIRHPDLIGDKVGCNICLSKFDHFLPIVSEDNTKRAKLAYCPICKSLERHRHMWPTLVSILKKDMSVLHFAPELVFAAYIYKAVKNYSACDIAPDKYKEDLPYITKNDITNITFANESFDLVICNHVLEHIIDDKKAMSECARVLKKGGKFLVSVPLFNRLDENYSYTKEERLEHYFQSDHVRLYDEKTFVQRLKDTAGFILVERYCADDLACDLAKYLGITHTYLGDNLNNDRARGNTFFICTKG